ncbi:tetratricopeptide repeat protein [Sulfitobacter sp. HNIBRBA3233]|uniref:tetratricopeptide repeat protein n=1 Tax=Sulfitobacter marinivivus TaxID=3158558 RepID=UPI0032DF0D41
MSDTDGFIDEVNDELRRDRMLGTLKRYGWIAVLVVLAIVGGAAYSEYRKAQARAQAESFGDSITAALEAQDPAARADALAALSPQTPTARATLDLLTASERVASGDRAAAIDALDAVALNGEVPQIYRQIAQFKALTLSVDTMPAAERRQGFEALTGAGGTLRLLAEEQLALIAIEQGEIADAVARYQALLTDAEVTPDLQQRALQVIVALGAEPDLDGTQAPDGGIVAPVGETND